MAKFIKSASSENGWIRDGRAEFCFIGRSNVGKSTLINALANQSIAKTSKTPGRTQLVNFFDFDNFRLVDLPGYGYARISREKQEDITKLIDEYISKRNNLLGVFQLCDISVITNQDIEMANFFSTRFNNHFVLLNKSDKLSRSNILLNTQKAAKLLKVDQNRVFVVSGKKKGNIGSIFATINNCIKNK